jgi:hypothetical protein
MKTTSVILVHEAFADRSSWGDDIPLLENVGYEKSAFSLRSRRKHKA